MNIQALQDELANRELQIQNLIAEITANQEEIRQLTFAAGLYRQTIAAHLETIKGLREREAGLLEELVKARKQEVRIK